MVKAYPLRVLLAAVFVAMPCAAFAQSSPPPVTDWSTNIETVVVTAERPGPALWHISANGSDVWILGSVSPLPRDLVWNTKQIEQIVDGADIVWLPPELTAGIFEVSWFLLTDVGSLKQPGDQTLEASLPPDLRDRFVAARTRLKKDADDYSDELPAIAALDLEGAFHKGTALDGDDVGERVQKIARAKDVPAKPFVRFEAMPIIKAIPKLSAEAERICLADALDDVDAQTLHADAAARAWAVGDLAGVKANYSETKLYDCFDQINSFAADREHITLDALAAIDGALAKAGKSLIVIGMGPLLRKNGVLDRLQERGIVVSGPAE